MPESLSDQSRILIGRPMSYEMAASDHCLPFNKTSVSQPRLGFGQVVGQPRHNISQ